MNKLYLASILQNAYSLNVMVGALIASTDWLDRKTVLLEDGELKEDCLTVLANARDTADTGFLFTVKNTMDIYDKVFENGKLVEEYIYDKDGLDLLLKLRDDFNNGKEVSSMTLDDKMKTFFAVTEMYQVFKAGGVESAENNEFISNYDFLKLDDRLYCARVMLETVSSVAFKRLTDYIIKDFGSDILDISATCVDIPVSSILDKVKYFSDAIEPLISSKDVDTTRALYLIKEQVERQIISIPTHAFSMIMNYLDDEAREDFINSFDIPNEDLTQEDRDNYVKFMKESLDKNEWNTRMIIVPITMDKEGNTRGLASLTVNYGHGNIVTSKAYDYAVNSLSSTIDKDIKNSIFAAYFISNFLKPVLDENTEEIVEKAEKIKYSTIYDLAKSNIGTQTKAITLDSLLDREDLPDNLRTEIEAIIEETKEGRKDIPKELLEAIGNYVSVSFGLGEAEETKEEEEILYN